MEFHPIKVENKWVWFLHASKTSRHKPFLNLQFRKKIEDNLAGSSHKCHWYPTGGTQNQPKNNTMPSYNTQIKSHDFSRVVSQGSLIIGWEQSPESKATADHNFIPKNLLLLFLIIKKQEKKKRKRYGK